MQNVEMTDKEYRLYMRDTLRKKVMTCMSCSANFDKGSNLSLTFLNDALDAMLKCKELENH